MSRKEKIFTSSTFEHNKTRYYINNPSPDRWPKFPYFPIKRWVKTDFGREMEVGLIFAAGKRSVVYLKNLFSIKPNMSIKQFLQSERIEYESVEDLLDDGWTGD